MELGSIRMSTIGTIPKATEPNCPTQQLYNHQSIDGLDPNCFEHQDYFQDYAHYNPQNLEAEDDSVFFPTWHAN